MKTSRQSKRSKGVILTMALILALILGSFSVYAADDNNDGFDDTTGQPINTGTVPSINADGVHVSKVVHYNEHQNFDLTFNYEATAKQVVLTQTYNGTSVTDTVESEPVEVCPEVTISPIQVVADGNTTYSATGLRVPKVNMTDGELTANEQGVITFGESTNTGAAAFPHAGVYAYTIEETAGATTGFNGHANGTDHLTYDTNTYTMRVYVVNDSNNNLAIESITMENESHQKVSRSDVLFNNTYVEKADPLEVKKVVSGAGGNKTKEFEFSVAFTAPSLGTMADGSDWDPTAITVSKKDANGTVTQTDVTVDSEGVAEFKLKHNEEMIFDNLPVGATYTVSETNLGGTGYTPTGQAVQNAQTRTAHVGNRGAAFTSDPAFVGELENKYTITNTADEITITGLVMNNLPIVLLVSLAAAAIAAYAVIRKKIATR